MISKVFTLSAALVLSFLPSSHSVERQKVDPTQPLTAAIETCANAEQLDCIESIHILASDGKRYPAKQSAPVSGQEEVDKQITEDGKSAWEYSLADGIKNIFEVDATITTPTFVVSGSSEDVTVETGPESDPEAESESEEEAETTKEVVSIDTRYFEPKLVVRIFTGEESNLVNSKKWDAKNQIEIVVRTSWLEIEESFLSGEKSSITFSQITNGKKITLVGSPVTIYQRQSIKDVFTGKINYRVVGKNEFEFIVLHPKDSASAPACYKNGFASSATNGSSVSLVDEQSENSLRFAVSGYRYLPNNANNLGFVEIRIPKKWLDCRFPNSLLSFGEKFEISVSATGDSSVKQTSQASATLVGDILEIKAQGIIFAKAEILVSTNLNAAKKKKSEFEENAKAAAKAEAEAKAKAEAEAKAKADAEAAAAAATAAAAAKSKKTITCVKGKLKKKVSGTNPKCPAGYKKK